MKATLANYRQSPRKVRLLADLVRGKNVAQAEIELSFASKRAALPILNLIQSAIANAQNNFQIGKADLIIKEIRVDKGIVLKRIEPRAFGRAYRINKRSSHVSVTLAPKDGAKVEKAEVVEAPKKKVAPAKKAVAKKPAVKKAAPKKVAKNK
jgi:large subunit ribosomal protein L22